MGKFNEMDIVRQEMGIKKQVLENSIKHDLPQRKAAMRALFNSVVNNKIALLEYAINSDIVFTDVHDIIENYNIEQGIIVEIIKGGNEK